MTSEELLGKITSTLSSDPLITSWCQETFGKIHTVCIDIDENSPPDPATEYPVVAVTSLRQTRGNSMREITWELEIGVGVIQENVETEGNTKVLIGFVQAETLRELVEDALYQARIADTGTRGETGSISHYPLFISGTAIPIKQLKSNRQRMPG